MISVYVAVKYEEQLNFGQLNAFDEIIISNDTSTNKTLNILKQIGDASTRKFQNPDNFRLG